MGLMNADDAGGLRSLTENAPKYNEDWERFASGDASDPEGWWDFGSDGVADNTNALSGSIAFHYDTTASSSFPTTAARSDHPSATTAYTEFTMAYYETTDSSGTRFYIENEDGEDLLAFGTDNPEVCVYDHAGHSDLHTPTTNYQEWRRLTATIDWETRTYDLLWEDITGGDANQSWTGRTLAHARPFNCGAVRLGPGGNSNVQYVWLDDVTGFKG